MIFKTHNLLKSIFTSFFILSLLVLGSQVLYAAMSSDNYQIWSDSISAGGGNDQSSGDYSLRDTIGEFAVGQSSSTDYNAKIGFREVNLDQVLTLTLSGSSIDLGELDSSSASTGSLQLTVETNSASGVSVTYTGSTLTCSACTGTNTVSSIGSSSAASNVGTSQFGFNAIYSSGSSPVASSVSPYNSSSQYAFNSGDEIISSSGAINSTVFNINFIANISGNEDAGDYSTTITYTATASF